MSQNHLSHEVLILNEYRNSTNYLRRVKVELEKAGLFDYLETLLDNPKYIKYAEAHPECLTIEDLIKNHHDFHDNYKDDDMRYAIDLRPLDYIYIESKYFIKKNK